MKFYLRPWAEKIRDDLRRHMNRERLTVTDVACRLRCSAQRIEKVMFDHIGDVVIDDLVRVATAFGFNASIPA